MTIFQHNSQKLNFINFPIGHVLLTGVSSLQVKNFKYFHLDDLTYHSDFIFAWTEFSFSYHGEERKIIHVVICRRNSVVISTENKNHCM